MNGLLVAGVALLGFAVSEPAAHAQRVSFVYTGKLDTFTVPKTGIYQIIAFGAQGGNDIFFSSSIGVVGLGAEIGGNFSLTAGEILQIAVGGAGGDGIRGGGGGGGSFVVGPGNTPLVIAGGGGSGGAIEISVGGIPVGGIPGGGGLTGPDGGGHGPGAPGGTDGNGGTAPSGGGGGGGGFFSAGGSSFCAGGGGAFPVLTGGDFGGGFGGGGGACIGFLGGGGGYSGGVGGDHHTVSTDPGGGGGSFDAGTDQILVADIWPGNGEVIIMEVSSEFAGTPGKANCHGQSVSALVKQYGGLNAAATALGFDSVDDLQSSIQEFCEA